MTIEQITYLRITQLFKYPIFWEKSYLLEQLSQVRRVFMSLAILSQICLKKIIIDNSFFQKGSIYYTATGIENSSKPR